MIPSKKKLIELENLADFKKIISKNSGFIIITDKTPFDHIHLPMCRLVNESNFKKKVIMNKRKRGSYFWVKKIGDAKKKISKLNECRLCNPN